MFHWRGVLLLLAVLLYFVIPWDLDAVPLFGRLDDVLLALIALIYLWKRKKALENPRRAERWEWEGEPSGGETPESTDPYRLLGVAREDSEESIKKAYRDLLGRYHPDRVQHLGEEFRQMADRKTMAFNRAYDEIRKERSFS